MIPLLRESSSYSSPLLPDDVIYQLLENFGPVEFLHYGWDRVSHGFTSMFERRLLISTSFDFRCILTDDLFSSRSSVSDFCLSFIISRLWHAKDIVMPMSILMKLVQSSRSFQFPRLNSLKVLITQDDNRRIESSALSFRERKTANADRLFSFVDKLYVEIEVNDEHNIPHLEFRRFSSFMKEIVNEWNVTLLDHTWKGQGWCPPCEIYHNREAFFVSYVRCLTDLGIRINRLRLEQCSEESSKTIHMHHEFKKCNHLYVLYNIGFTASFIDEVYPNLKSITLKDQANVMLEQYFESAPSISKIQILKEEKKWNQE